MSISWPDFLLGMWIGVVGLFIVVSFTDSGTSGTASKEEYLKVMTGEVKCVIEVQTDTTTDWKCYEVKEVK